MKNVWLIARRELTATLRSPLGFVVAALVLALDGLLFNLWAMGGGEKLSAEVLYEFFYAVSGTTMVAAVFISMRLLAEEQQTGTINLLLTSPIRDHQIVLGKFLGAYLFLALLTLVTLYMPLLIMVHGKISWGHLLAGYLGLLLLGAAALAIGTFGSCVARSQVVAAFVAGGILVALLLMWLLGRVADRPLADVFSYLALHNAHFKDFMGGKIHLRDIVYYLSVSAFFLVAATRMLESRRWR
ncbi:MAG TPA: ABC transporter permease [Myxococcota bacterium]|nr:ABC transporter permease [Myxococcota bacterium]HRY95457.1 ABC transporter permease [Myxococcota bacterium]HSA22126.1 ABC transporter permease [Myxococcota bacterium]